jgi:hypothetical protein
MAAFIGPASCCKGHEETAVTDGRNMSTPQESPFFYNYGVSRFDMTRTMRGSNPRSNQRQ